jgi:hypothetical protein
MHMHERIRSGEFMVNFRFKSKAIDPEAFGRYRRELDEKKAAFKAAALEDVGLTGKPYADKLFARAWEQGHAFGYAEVYDALIDIAEFFAFADDKPRPKVAVKVTDPDKMINWLSIVEETDAAVVLHGDMNRPGKRAEVVAGEKNTFVLCNEIDGKKHRATIEFVGLSPDMFDIHAAVGRYSLFIVLINRSRLVNDRKVYLRLD